MKFILVIVLLGLSFPMVSFSAAGCIGKVSKLWVEKDGTLNFNLTPSNSCVCNYSVGEAKGFASPAGSLNKNEQYAALLAAFMGNKEVMAWFDWTNSSSNVSRCTSWNISLSE